LDLVALALFVLVGMRSHAAGSRAEIFLRNAVPIGLAWLGVAVLLQTYRPPSIARLVKTWLVAIPIGVLVRALWVGSPDGARFFVFLGVTMAFTAMFLAVERLVALLVRRRRWLR
jgi:hypothetical protein